MTCFMAPENFPLASSLPEEERILTLCFMAVAFSFLSVEKKSLKTFSSLPRKRFFPCTDLESSLLVLFSLSSHEAFNALSLKI